MITGGDDGHAIQSDDSLRNVDVFRGGELRRTDAQEGDREAWARWFIATQLWWNSVFRLAEDALLKS